MIQPQFCSETFDGYQKILSNFIFFSSQEQPFVCVLLLMGILELDYLAVHPDNQGRGVATRLVEHGIAEANKLGIDIIVMAYKAAVGVYKRLGFETVETLLQDDSQYGGDGEFGVYYMVFKVSK
jgi:ribosomal protein S18 acetylase RimI-like enzyme